MRFRRRGVVLLLAPALLLAACSGGDSGRSDASRKPSASPKDSASASPSPTPSPTPAAVWPLTGLPADPSGRLVALKIDNSPYARPFFAGLDRADVVYEELVEGGTTRMLAVFGSKPAPKVGPIRSVRDNDLELLAQYGRVLFGFSGGNKSVLRAVAKSNVVDVSFDVVPSGYVRGARRPDAYNFFTSTARLLAARPKSDQVKDVGFRFGAAPPAKTPAAGLNVAWSGRAQTAFAYDPASGSWMRSMDGRPSTLSTGARVGFANVIVQYVAVRKSAYTDVNGERSPYTTTIGAGRAQVFRDGQVIDATWHRSNAAGGTRYLDATKHDVALRPGPIWVLLVPNSIKASVH